MITVPLKHIKVMVLPPSIASLMQSCDQGLINAFKVYCHQHEMGVRVLKELENKHDINRNELGKKTNHLEALNLLVMLWNLISSATIKNCFVGARFSEAKKDELKTLETTENVSSDTTNEDYEA